MRTASFVIVLLLAAVLVDAGPTTAHETSSIPARLGRSLRGFLASGHSIWASAGQHADETPSRIDSNKLTVGIGAGEEAKHIGLPEKCFTKAHCKKKKVICSKKCSKSHGDVEKKHSAGKCVVKCKKCIPNC